MTARGVAGGFLGLAALVFGGPALATPGPADEAIAHGVELRRLHRDEEALADFQRAYSIEPTARALAQIALAEAALEQWSSAEADLLRSLALSDPWIDRQRPVLRVALGEIQAHLGTLELSGPVGAQVWIDGVLVTRLPKAFVRVPARRMVLELRAAGSTPARRELEVAAGASVRIALDLQPERPEPPRSPGAPTGGPAPGGPDERTTASGARRVTAWVAGGSATLALAAGVAFTTFVVSHAARYNGGACDDQPGEPRSQRCSDDASAVRTGEVGEAVSYGLAGIGALTSAILFATLSRGRASLALLPDSVSIRYAF